MNKIATTKQRLVHELFAFWIPLFISFTVQDGWDILNQLYSRNFSGEVLFGLKVLLVGSLIKVLLVKIAPSLFPLYKTNIGIIEPTENKDEPV